MISTLFSFLNSRVVIGLLTMKVVKEHESEINQDRFGAGGHGAVFQAAHKAAFRWYETVRGDYASSCRQA